MNGIKNIFEVENNTKTIQFKPKGKFYILAKEVNDAVVLDTIERTERLFAEREVEQANEARLFQRQ